MFTEIVGCTQKNQEECTMQSMQTVADFELPRMAKRSSQKKVSWHNVQEVLGFMFGASGMRETKDHHQGYPNLTTSCDVKSPDFLEIPWVIALYKLGDRISKMLEMVQSDWTMDPLWSRHTKRWGFRKRSLPPNGRMMSHGRGPGVSGES